MSLWLGLFIIANLPTELKFFFKKKILILELGWLGSDFGVAGTILPDQFLHVIRKDATERDVASLYN